MSRMVPQLVATEEDRVSNYIQGFPSELRRLVKGSAPETFQRAIELTADLFEELYGHGGRPESVKRKRDDDVGELKRNLVTCKKCDKTHKGECKLGTNSCYKCGKEGHFADKCPGKISCYNCGEEGHKKDKCPKGKP